MLIYCQEYCQQLLNLMVWNNNEGNVDRDTETDS